MEKRKYKSPEVSFQEMRLLESVADKCWGWAYAWYDADEDGYLDEGEKVDLRTIGLGNHGCQGDSAEQALVNYFRNHFSVTITTDEVKVNTRDSILQALPDPS